MSWEQTKKIALLGTDRMRLPERLRKELQSYGVTEGSEGQMLLQALTLFRQMDRAGQPLQAATVKSMREQRPTDAIRKAPPRMMERLLYGSQRGVLPEALSLMQQYAVRIPNEFLPELLSWLDEHPNHLAAVRNVLDERAECLVAKHPAWKKYSLDLREDTWYYGNPDERKQWLSAFRQKDPVEALKYLQESWPKEHPQDKCLFLSVFKVPKLPEEESFLAKALVDTQKEVRQMAAKMLALRPDHAYRHQVFAKAKEHIYLNDTGELQVVPPGQQDDSLIQLGIGYTRKGISAKQTRRWVWDMVRLVPPAFWETWTKCSAPRALRIFARANDRLPLLEALVEASVLHGDEQWMAALLRLGLREEEEVLDAHQGRKLLRELPDHVLNEVMTSYLHDQPNALFMSNLARQVLLAGSQAWSIALTRAVIRPFREGLSGGSRLYGWEWEGYQPVLDKLAMRCPPEMFDELRQGWNRGVGSWGMWEKRIDQALKTVHFRQGMHRYFTKEYATDA